ncbi:sensor histidine kinase [Paenibacillus psychroresistens]|uniref:Sensor histidine kinase n=1 Tax=Paenibacillus psychroresistens TaxID=1778678 RepID=A0A6B8RKU8_9BACL|nr:sensor histidine kinase [Paenibacillus psychroresistens]QGQ96046.1 sensor histidine kinase [Paenibacillus psychroresistens]
MKLLGKLQNMRIRNKIFIIYIPLILLPLFIVIYTSNHILTSSIFGKTQKNIHDESKLITTRIAGILSNANIYINILTIEINNIYEENNITSNDPVELVKSSNQIHNAIAYHTQLFQEIDYAAFIDINSRVISPAASSGDFIGLFNKDIMKTLQKNKTTSNVWFAMQKRDYLVNDSNRPIITLGKRVVSTETGQTLGFLIVNINEDTISSIFPAISSSSKGYFIVDQQGIVVSSSHNEDVLKPAGDNELIQWMHDGDTVHKEVEIKGELNLLTQNTIEGFDWKLINQIQVSELTHDTYVNTLVIVGVGVICIGIAFLSVFFLSKLIANPIIKLTRLAKEVKRGNLDVTFKSEASDEVGILASVFDAMIEKVRELLRTIKSEQKKKREYEFNLIQSQIQPHFLYNTIETINMFIRLDMKENALKTTEALVSFYRISLSKGNNIIRIKEEIRLIESYLSIQAFRYVDYMDYTIDIDEEILEYDIPKLTLQPLVENAIYHGLKIKNSKGSLAIRGYRSNNFIIIEVHDNGVGMSASKINEILEQSSESNDKINFGVSSVSDRIKLFYGDNSGLKIESVQGDFTKITIFLEIKEMKVDE